VPITGAVGVEGCAGITTLADGTERQPSAVVTVKLYVFVGNAPNVELVPVPVVEIVPGYLTRVHVPVAGNPERRTLPVAKVQLGGVIVPTIGADGVDGCGLITTFPEGEDIHPVELVTEKVYVPDGIDDIVTDVPEPEIVTLPGILVIVQLPEAGKPLRITLPVELEHVVWVIVPTTGAVGAAGAGDIVASFDTGDVHPSALVTIKLYVPATSPDTVVLTPVPFVSIEPGFLIRVQVPVAGRLLRTTLPVATAQVRFVIVPIAGATGIALTVRV
jgi:hypothetical protein